MGASGVLTPGGPEPKNGLKMPENLPPGPLDPLVEGLLSTPAKKDMPFVQDVKGGRRSVEISGATLSFSTCAPRPTSKR